MSAQELLQQLHHSSHTIRDLERKAQAQLAANDTAAYRQCMLQKASLLQNLYPNLESIVCQLPDAERLPIEERLRAFSKSADTALRLESVFFMSALLYPEDYAPGSLNDLEHYIQTLEVRLDIQG